MLQLLNIMLNVIAPIFLIIGVAAFIGRRFRPDPNGLSVFLIYFFVPALVFRGLANTELGGAEIGGIAFVAVGFAIAMAVIGTLLVRSGISGLPRNDPRAVGAFVLTLVLVNAANYGIPLNTFAFGEDGGNIAVIYYVVSAIVGNVMGVYYASLGQGTARQAMLNVLRVPIGYAALAGLVVNMGDIALPLPLERSINLAADAAIPGMLALLGLSLSKITIRGRIRPILIASGVKLLIAPLIAVPLALIVGLQGAAFQVSVVESSMPTAVLASALASQFGSDTEFTTAVTLVSTVASVITLSVLIAILGGPVG